MSPTSYCTISPPLACVLKRKVRFHILPHAQTHRRDHIHALIYAQEAEKALQLHNTDFMGRTISVDPATESGSQAHRHTQLLMLLSIISACTTGTWVASGWQHNLTVAEVVP